MNLRAYFGIPFMAMVTFPYWIVGVCLSHRVLCRIMLAVGQPALERMLEIWGTTVGKDHFTRSSDLPIR